MYMYMYKYHYVHVHVHVHVYTHVFLYTLYYEQHIILDDCLITSLASGYDPTCRIGCVAFRPRERNAEILVTFLSWCCIHTNVHCMYIYMYMYNVYVHICLHVQCIYMYILIYLHTYMYMQNVHCTCTMYNFVYTCDYTHKLCSRTLFYCRCLWNYSYTESLTCRERHTIYGTAVQTILYMYMYRCT